MKVLITGAAGFIGFHLARLLLEEGHEIVGIDSMSDYYPLALKRARLAELEKYGAFRFIELNLADNKTLLDLCLAQQFDRVCHLAAQPGVRHSIDHPFDYQESNMAAFLSVLEACRHARIPRLVYASSSSVYGGNKKLPFHEDDPAERPVSLYASTKRSNELMASTYVHLYKFQAVGLRFFTVYGPWGRPDMALWSFTEAVLNGRPLPVFNNGQMLRDYTYVDDIVAGVRASLFADGLDAHEIINIGNHRAEKLLDLIRVIGEAAGREPVLDMKPMQPGDVPATYADIDRARTKLGFEPTTNIDVGVRRFVEWYRAHPDIAEAVRTWREAGSVNAETTSTAKAPS